MNGYVKKITEEMLESLGDLQVIIKCETCGMVFLDIPYNTFLKLHDPIGKDKYYPEVVLHWCHNPTHIITSNMPDVVAYNQGVNIPFNWSERMKKTLEERGISPKQCILFYTEMREKLRSKPI